jgi:hypothetical protein
LLCVALATTSCSGDDETPEPPESQSTATGSALDIETVANVGRIAGRLPKKEQRRLTDRVTETAQRWFNAAYIAGEYPRKNFSNAFPGFTRPARAEASRDRDLMSNAGVGDRITDVTATRSRIWVDVLAPRKRAVGVTARFELRFRTEGDYARNVVVRGRLFMTHREAGWRIFGYDVSKADR